MSISMVYTKVAVRLWITHSLPFDVCVAMVHDVAKRGRESLFFGPVSAATKTEFGPEIEALKRIGRHLADAMVEVRISSLPTVENPAPWRYDTRQEVQP